MAINNETRNLIADTAIILGAIKAQLPTQDVEVAGAVARLIAGIAIDLNRIANAAENYGSG